MTVDRAAVLIAAFALAQQVACSVTSAAPTAGLFAPCERSTDCAGGLVCGSGACLPAEGGIGAHNDAGDAGSFDGSPD